MVCLQSHLRKVQMKFVTLIACVFLVLPACGSKTTSKPAKKAPAAKTVKKSPAPAAKKAPAPAAKKAPASVAKKAPAGTTAPAQAAKNVAFSQLAFKPFNPKNPKGIHVYFISGNPKAGAFSAMVKLPPGYNSGLHTHTADYTGIAMSAGLSHTLTKAPGKPLPKGSYWYQPGGEAHVDACHTKAPCYMLAMFKGAVDMKPVKEPATAPKAVITPADKIKWAELKGGVKMAVIDGNPKKGPFQALFHFPAGMTTNVHTHSAAFTGALLAGTHQRGPRADRLVTLGEKSVWHEPANSPHMEKCGAKAACIIVGAFNGPLDTKAVKLTPAKKPAATK
jgi:quercetin dioxygenase-like cupin family protein